MLLRRVTEHVKTQNWFAVGIDLVIVVVGVFIGIQVSNWNDDRVTRKKADVFTERLAQDLRKEAWGYQSVISYSRQTNANQRRVLQALAGERELSDEQFLISAYRATQFREHNRHRATYDELVSTGTIGLITDPVLREAAVGMFTTGFLEEFAERIRDSEYRQLFRETVPAPVQEALLARCGDRYPTELDYESLDVTLDYPCSLELPEEAIRLAARTLRVAPRLVPALRVRFADNQTALTDLQDGNLVVVESLKAIRERQP